MEAAGCFLWRLQAAFYGGCRLLHDHDQLCHLGAYHNGGKIQQSLTFSPLGIIDIRNSGLSKVGSPVPGTDSYL